MSPAGTQRGIQKKEKIGNNKPAIVSLKTHQALSLLGSSYTGVTMLQNKGVPSPEYLACKPYSLNRFLCKPIIIWTIDKVEYAVFGINSWCDAIIQLYTNNFPWGKAPIEWMKNNCFKNYIHKKEDEHNKLLEDPIEKKIINLNLMYDRNVRKIKTSTGIFNIEVKDLGEIDFIIVAKKINTIFLADCKYLLKRYDMVNQRNDYNAFTSGKKPYNLTMSKKIKWINDNLQMIEQHFQTKYNDDVFKFENYKVEGIFIVHTPTFYMYNSEYKIYTIEQIDDVLQGQYSDPSFMVYHDGDDDSTFISVKYPYFKNPEYIKYDPLFDESSDK